MQSVQKNASSRGGVATIFEGFARIPLWAFMSDYKESCEVELYLMDILEEGSMQGIIGSLYYAMLLHSFI